MNKFFLLSAMVMSIAAGAGTPRTQTALTTELKDGTFKASLTDSYHFNEKAPNSLNLDGKILKPKTFSAHELVFDSIPENFNAGKASLYVCDDALTFCEPRTIEFKGKGDGKIKPPKASKKHVGGLIKHGFLAEEFDSAVFQAKQKNQLVLVDFGARWCPGCMRLENEIFDKPEFKAASKNFSKVTLDLDRFENSVLKDRFKVLGIPTLLILNANQEEIDRLYDFQPMDTIQKFLSSAQADPTTLKQLAAKVAGGDSAAALTLGQRLTRAGQFGDAVKVLVSVKPAPPELATAELGLAAEKFAADKNEAAYEAALKKAIASEPKSSRSIEWRGELVELTKDPAEKQKILDEGVALADSLLAEKEKLKEAMKTDLVGEFTGFEPMKVAQNKVELLIAGEAPAEKQKEAWATLAKVSKDLGVTAKNRGPAIRYLTALIKAEDFKEANKLSILLMKVDPGNAEMQYRRLRVLMVMKNYSEAIELGKIAIKNSYGRNEYWIAENLAKAYIAEKRKPEAKAILDQYLSRPDIDWPSMQSSRKSLEELRSQVTM